MLYFQHNLDARQINWLDSRAYTNDKVNYYPSVTTILGIIDKGANFKEWLINNGRNSDYITMKAMDEGSQVHGLIERFCINPESPINCITYDGEGREVHSYNKDVWTMFSRFIAFYRKVRPKLIAVEQALCDNELGYGGSVDIICEFNGLRWLIDNKTGSYIYDEYDLQMAAYSVLWNKTFPDLKIDRTAILHLDAQTRTEGKGDAIQGKGWKLVTNGDQNKYQNDFLLFNNAFQLWHWRNPSWRPLFVELPDHYTRDEIDNEINMEQ